MPNKKPTIKEKKDLKSLIVENIATLLLLQLGQCIALPLSSTEYLLIVSKICCALKASLANTFSLTPPIALLTKGSVSIVK